jgi:hypothetical protein
MSIDLTRRRRGEIGMEAMLILPATIIIILLARLIMEGMLVRQEVGVFTRSGTAAAAEAESTLPIYCISDLAPFSERPAVTQFAAVVCRERHAEQGLSTQPDFWDAIRQGAQPWDRYLRDINQTDHVMDMTGEGAGGSRFTGPAFLAQVPLMTTRDTALFPQGTLWPHHDDPFRAATDPVFWDALRERDTWKLFPEVFPSRDG